MDRVGSPWRKKKNRGALLRGGTALAHKRSRLGLEGRDRRSNFIRIFFLFRLLRETSSELWVDSRGVWFDTLSYEWSVIDAPSLPPLPPLPLLPPWTSEHLTSTVTRGKIEQVRNWYYRVFIVWTKLRFNVEWNFTLTVFSLTCAPYRVFIELKISWKKGKKERKEKKR